VNADVSGGEGGVPGGGPSAARKRSQGPDFSISFLALQGQVTNACARHTEWQARIAAGIEATLVFVAEHPSAAWALMIEGRGRDPREAACDEQVLFYFNALLTKTAPADQRLPISSDQGIVDTVATVVRGYLLAGMEGQLPAMVPDFVYVALMPYAGFEAARHWAEVSSSPLLR
jgi:hypothetical protein